jgi:hypothetical protein
MQIVQVNEWRRGPLPAPEVDPFAVIGAEMGRRVGDKGVARAGTAPDLMPCVNCMRLYYTLSYV